MITIILDPGHGGADPGARSLCGKTREKDLNLAMAKRVAQLLTGYEVKFTRTSDRTLKDSERTAAVRMSGAKLCLSLHHNAFNKAARGVEVIHSINSDGRIARAIYGGIIKAGIPGRRVFSRESETHLGRDYYFMIRDTAPVESVIVEFGFIDSNEDFRLITDPAVQDEMAKAVADAVLDYLGATGPVQPVLSAGVTATRVILEGVALPGIIISGRSYLQVREMERAGYLVEWDGKTVIVKKGI